MHGKVKVQTGCPGIENILSLVSIWKGTVLRNLLTLSALAWRLPNAILGFSPQCWTSSKAKRVWVALWEDERSFWDLRGKLIGMERRVGRGAIWEEVDSGTGVLGESFIWTRNWWWLVNVLVIMVKHTLSQEANDCHCIRPMEPRRRALRHVTPHTHLDGKTICNCQIYTKPTRNYAM